MVSLKITGGPEIQVQWFSGINGQTLLEAAYNAQPGTETFTFMLQYYGSALGYLVEMINGTFDSFLSKDAPYFFWDFIVNGTSSNVGVDSVILKDGDTVTFTYTTYNPVTHAQTTLGNKLKAKLTN